MCKMQSDPETGIEPKKTFWIQYNLWMKKNWFTMVAIIIVLLGLWIELSTVEVQKVKVAQDCNDAWINQVKTVCPGILARQSGFSFNLSDT
jgi:hypothetical protein